MAKAACSIEAGRLAPEDRVAYAKTVGLAARKAFVAKRLEEAIAWHSELIQKVQEIHPGLIDERGEFVSEVAAQQLTESAAAAQLSFGMRPEDYAADETASRVRRGKAALERGKYANKARGSQSGAARVAGKKQAGSAGTVEGGNRAAAGPTSTRSAPEAGEKKRGAAALKRGRSAADRQGATKTEEGEPAQQVQPVAVVRKEQQQPTDVRKFRSPNHAWDTLKDEVRPNVRSFASLLSGGKAAMEAAAKWKKLYSDGKASVTALKGIVNDLDPTPEEMLSDAMMIASTATDKREFIYAAKEILSMALFPPSGVNYHAAGKRAADIAYGREPLLWDSPNVTYTLEAFMDLVQEMDNPTYTHGGKERPWAKFAYEKGLIAKVHELAPVEPSRPSDRIAKAIEGVTNKNTITTAQLEPGNMRSVHIASVLSAADAAQVRNEGMGVPGLSKAQQEEVTAEIKGWLAGNRADLTYRYRDVPLERWLTRGAPEWALVPGSQTRAVLVVPDGATASVSEQLAAADKLGVEGRSSVVDGEPIASSMSHGSVKLFVAKTMRKFNEGARPRVLVYTSVEEFKRRKPDLYMDAVRSRPDRRAIPDNAAGYAFGNTMVVFSSNIKSKQHLAFVIAHEVIGHFGLASIMPRAERIKLMEQIYDYDATIRAEADRRMDLYGQDKAEAVEEAMADYAAVIDTNVVARVWSYIKRFLAKLGFAYTDDMATYFVHQSRRYARTGRTGDVTAHAVYNNWLNLDQRAVEGRASAGTNVLGASIASTYGWAHPSIGHGVGRFAAMMKRFQSKSGAFENARSIGTAVGKTMESFQTLDNMALRSFGLSKIAEIFRQEGQDIRQFQTILSGIIGDVFKARFLGFGQGLTTEEEAVVGELMAQAALYKNEQLGSNADTLIKNAPALTRIASDGTWERNEAGIKAAREFGKVTRAQFAKGLARPKYDDSGNQIIDPKTNKPETWLYKPSIDIMDAKYDKMWDAFTKLRAGIEESALQVMMTKLEGITGQQTSEFQYIRDMNQRDGESVFSEDDINTLRMIADVYSKYYNEQAVLEGAGLKINHAASKNAEAFLYEITRAFHNDAKLKDWVSGNASSINPNTGKPEGSERFRQDDDVKPIIAKLKHLRSLGLSENRAAQIRKTIADMVALETQGTNAEYRAKQTIMGAYAPFRRTGKFQVSVRARDAETGQDVVLPEGAASMLPYTQTDSLTQAKAYAQFYSELFNFTADVQLEKGANQTTKVEFYAVQDEAATRPPMTNSIDYDTFVSTLVRLGVNISPQQREDIIQKLASHHSMARRNLMRSGNPGWDANMVRSTAEYLETQTHLAGKNRHRHRLEEIMADRTGKYWFGSERIRSRLASAVEDAKRSGNEAALFNAQQALTQYEHMMYHSRGETRITKPDGTTETTKGLGKGNRYRDVASSLISFHNQSPDILDTLDTRIDRAAGPLMETAAIAQLGLSFATAGINLMSIGTHAAPYLATFNQKTGYGGGHSIGKAVTALSRAAKDMGLFSRKLSNAVELKKIIEADKWAAYGFQSRDEAVFIQEQTEKGILTPNLTNLLVGTSRAGRQSNNRLKAVELAMMLFAKTEQFNRRVTALAAYRLEKERMLLAGTKLLDIQNTKSSAAQHLASRAVDAVNYSQGEYALYNRPAWARSGLGKVLYTYKQFVVITIELMNNLAPKERVMFLAAITLLSGIKGLPFAEDLVDVIDTLMQKFHIKSAGVEAEVARLVDAIIPGATPVVMRGVIDNILETTASTRLGHGDLIPGTGMFKAGSDLGRELTNIAGPVASAVTSILGGISAASRYGAEAVGIREGHTTISDVARTGLGVSGLRGLSEGIIYMSDGSITNERGQVISQEFGPLSVVFRMLGFYPGNATVQNDVTRMGKNIRAYVTEIKASYVNAMRVAAASGDHAEMARIRADVQRWNREVGRSVFFIKDFGDASARAIREAKKPTAARFLKSAPQPIKPFSRELMRIYGLSEQ